MRKWHVEAMRGRQRGEFEIFITRPHSQRKREAERLDRQFGKQNSQSVTNIYICRQECRLNKQMSHITRPRRRRVPDDFEVHSDHTPGYQSAGTAAPLARMQISEATPCLGLPSPVSAPAKCSIWWPTEPSGKYRWNNVAFKSDKGQQVFGGLNNWILHKYLKGNSC